MFPFFDIRSLHYPLSDSLLHPKVRDTRTRYLVHLLKAKQCCAVQAQGSNPNEEGISHVGDNDVREGHDTKHVCGLEGTCSGVSSDLSRSSIADTV